MKTPSSLVRVALTGLLVFYLCCRASAVMAGSILQPIAANSDMGTGYGSLDALRNQSGLSKTYQNLLDDFDTYIASGPTHNTSPDVNGWSSLRTIGNLDFNLGGSYIIESMALWNADGLSLALKDFEIFLDDEPLFSSPVSMGSFIATNSGYLPASNPQIFTFLPTTASYVRLSITSNYGDSRTVIGEVAFEQSDLPLPPPAAVPEPTTIVLWGGMAVTLALARYRNGLHRV